MGCTLWLLLLGTCSTQCHVSIEELRADAQELEQSLNLERSAAEEPSSVYEGPITTIVMSTPEWSKKKNTTHDWSVEAMKELAAKAATEKNWLLAYDWAGSSNGASLSSLVKQDHDNWSEIFDGSCDASSDKECMSEGDRFKFKGGHQKKIALNNCIKYVMATSWWAKFEGGLKNALKLEGQRACKAGEKLRLVAIRGGPITAVEQHELPRIISESMQDLHHLMKNTAYSKCVPLDKSQSFFEWNSESVLLEDYTRLTKTTDDNFKVTPACYESLEDVLALSP
jgi:hypothetical protein